MEHNFSSYLYIELHPGAEVEALKEKMAHLYQQYKYVEMFKLKVFNPRLQPLTRIHLHSHLEDELGDNRQVTDLYLIALIALLILFIACINYVNLATAQSARRAKEVGVRKVAGANRRLLIRQFLGEAWLFVSLTVRI